MFKRLVSTNVYPRKFVESLSKQKCEQSIVCVGNTMERIRLEDAVKDGNSVLLFGSGKMTAAMWVIDKLDLDYEIDYSGEELFDDTPLFNKDTVFVIRYKEPSELLGRYISEGARIILLCNEPYSNSECVRITLQAPSPYDLAEYLKLKGEDMTINIPSEDDISDKQLLIEALRKGTRTYIPQQELWYAQNVSLFKDYTPHTILQLCALANEVEDEYWKGAVLSMIRNKRPIDLKPPNYGRWK
jgi:hypothetical protein